IRSADDRCQGLTSWSVAVHGAGSGSRRHVDCEHTQKLAFGIEHLDAPVRPIAYVDVVVAVHRNRVREVELPRAGAALAPRFDPVTVLVVFCDAGIDVAVADVDVAFGVPGYVSGMAEETFLCRKASV